MINASETMPELTEIIRHEGGDSDSSDTNRTTYVDSNHEVIQLTAPFKGTVS
jgi:hypothetical protein